jgi:hypothetical protein
MTTHDDEQDAQIAEPLVILKINRRWAPTMSVDQLYETTRGWWAANPRRMFRAEYAAGVAHGIIRSVYRVDSWRERVPGDRDWHEDFGNHPRWGFCGAPAPELAHLIGQSVKHMHKQGAANPVVPLNCGDDLDEKPLLRGLGARAIAMSEGLVVLQDTAEDEEIEADDDVDSSTTSPTHRTIAGPSAELRTAVEGLQSSPLHVLSLSSRELFFSNLVGWMVESFPQQMEAALKLWLKDQGDDQTVAYDRPRVLREWQNLDVCIDLPGMETLVLENKTLSMPDDTQLAGYDTKISKAAGKDLTADPSKVLFAPVDPGWTDGIHQASAGASPWRWLSFDVLADRIDAIDWPAPGSYETQTVEQFSTLLRGIARVLRSDAARPSLDAPLDLPPGDLDVLSTVRLHHLVKKARARHVGNLIQERLAEEGLAERVGIRTNLSHAQTLLDGLLLRRNESSTNAGRGDRLQWQIQGGQLRLAIVLPSLAGKSLRDHAARVAVAEQHLDWFDFSEARRILDDRCGPESGAWLKFNPDFAYRNVKITDATVEDAVSLGVAYSRRLVDQGPLPMGG